MRILKNLIFLSIPSLFICIIFGELFFRFVIPAAQMPWGYYDPIDQIARFEADQGIGLYTIGRLAQRRVRWRINNVGWNSDIDYLTKDKRSKPLIAIIGDSYIEAFQVDIKDSIVSVLRRKLGEKYDVYGFGSSGAALSQYLQMSRYVNKVFDPDIIVVNVVHNDFDESLLSVVDIPYFLSIQLVESEPQESKLPTIPIAAKRITKILFKSSTFGYIFYNLDWRLPLTRLGFVHVENRAIQKKSQTDELLFAGNKASINDIYKAVDYVIRKMKEENKKKELIFMIDAPRRDIYKGNVDSSSVLWMNKMLKTLCECYNCRVIDLTQPFLEKFQSDHVPFNNQDDYHWNEEGHRLAAEVLHRSFI